MSKLKRCPFCGGEARLEQVPGATWDKFVVTCKSMKCCAFYIGYCDEGIYDTKTKAIEAWNTRKPVENVMKRLEEAKNTEIKVIGGRCNGKSFTVGYSEGIREAINIIKAELGG